MHSHSHNHHDHGHGHSHALPLQPNRAFIIGIVLNLGYVIMEIVYGLLHHSLALLTDAGHNLGDVAGLGLSLLAFRLAKVKATTVYTYGYKKTTILAALLNSMILMLGVGILGYESVIRIQHPQPVEGGIIAWVAALGIVINGISAMLFFRGRDQELNIKGAYLHMLTDAVVSLGVVISGIIIAYTHWYILDAIVSIAVILIILKGTWSLLTDSFRLSLDAVPPDINLSEITTRAEKVPGVKEFHHIHIWAMSTTENALTAHLVVENNVDNSQITTIKKELKHQLQHLNIQHITLETEFQHEDCKPDC